MLKHNEKKISTLLNKIANINNKLKIYDYEEMNDLINEDDTNEDEIVLFDDE